MEKPKDLPWIGKYLDGRRGSLKHLIGNVPFVPSGTVSNFLKTPLGPSPIAQDAMDLTKAWSSGQMLGPNGKKAATVKKALAELLPASRYIKKVAGSKGDPLVATGIKAKPMTQEQKAKVRRNERNDKFF